VAAEPVPSAALVPAPTSPTAATQAARRAAGSRMRLARANAPWFPRALREVARDDERAAGRLLLALMPLLGLTWPRDAAFDLDIAETGCVAVDVRHRVAAVSARLEPRPAESVDFVLRTDLAGLARTALSRRTWRATGSSRGDARRILRSLTVAPLSLGSLLTIDGTIDPRLLFRLLAHAVDPEWTVGHSFTVGFRTRDRARQLGYVRVSDGAAVKMTDTPPFDDVRATLTSNPRDLVELLLGRLELDGPRTRVSGDVVALAQLLDWFTRADGPGAPAAARREETP
jgi:hypothetical protein